MEEASNRAADIAAHKAVQLFVKKQKLTITNVKDVGVDVMKDNLDPAFFEENFAGTASYVL